MRRALLKSLLLFIPIFAPEARDEGDGDGNGNAVNTAEAAEPQARAEGLGERRRAIS